MSSATVKTCRDFEKGMPREERPDWARMSAKASENPLMASGDFFRYSSRFRHRSTRGVANEGTAAIIHLIQTINVQLNMGRMPPLTLYTMQPKLGPIELDEVERKKLAPK